MKEQIDWKAKAEAAEAEAQKYQNWYEEEEGTAGELLTEVSELKATLERVRSITVEDMDKAIQSVVKRTSFSDGNIFNWEFISNEIHSLLTDRLEGKR